MSTLIRNIYSQTGMAVTDSEKAFDTYRYYLSCFREELTREYANIEKLTEEILRKYTSVSLATHAIDEKVIRRFLLIAWNTEYLAKANISSEVEIIRISNQWRPIQAYYSIYSAGEAVSYVLDGTIAESHSKCIRVLNAFFVERTKISPWHFAYTGNIRTGFTSHNFPNDTKPISNLTRTGARPGDIIATCLQAEHRNRIEDFEPKSFLTHKRNKD